MMKRPNHVVHLIVMGLIRLILFFTFVYAIMSNRPLIQVVSLIALFITFIPWIFKKIFNIDIPAGFEVIYLMFIYGILIMGELRGFYSGLWWWSILITFTSSIVLGFIGLSIIHVLYKHNKISVSPFFGAILIFSLAVSINVLWEIFEFTLDVLIHSGLQRSLFDTMEDLSINIIGVLLVSIAGFFHIKKGNQTLVSTYFTKILERHLGFLSQKPAMKDMKTKFFDLIQTGETNKVEFKSSLRTNLHTGQFDKKIELSTLKTIVAFLNTKGGNLLIGVNDNGQILGLEKDGFQNNDKTALHFTNLIKYHIGNEFLPFIGFSIIEIQNKKTILVTCMESQKRVFLKTESGEEFYVRNGPASVKLNGNSLIDYVQHKFKN